MKPKSKQRGVKPSLPVPPQLPVTSPLAGFLTLEEYQAPRTEIFPTLTALRWFVSENKRQLLDADALRQHRSRLLLHDTRTDMLVDIVGREAAERRFDDVLQGAEPSGALRNL